MVIATVVSTYNSSFVSSPSASNRTTAKLNAGWEVRQTIVQCGVRTLVLSVTLRNAIYSGVRV